MNRVTIINGLKGEGKTSELMVGDFMCNVKSDTMLKHRYITTQPYESTVASIEGMLSDMRKELPEFAKGANMGVYHIDTWDDLTRITRDNDDASSVLYIDGTEDLDHFDMGEFLKLVDTYQFDCYITRQRCKEDRG